MMLILSNNAVILFIYTFCSTQQISIRHSSIWEKISILGLDGLASISARPIDTLSNISNRLSTTFLETQFRANNHIRP